MIAQSISDAGADLACVGLRALKLARLNTPWNEHDEFRSPNLPYTRPWFDGTLAFTKNRTDQSCAGAIA